MTQYIRSRLSSLREYLTPISHESTFASTGEITPEEFVAAGDYLASRFPTWQWGSTPADKQRDFLPADRQYLVTRHVPCRQRVDDAELAVAAATYAVPSGAAGGDEDGDGGEEWEEMHTQPRRLHHTLTAEDERSVKEQSDDELVDMEDPDIDDLIDDTVQDAVPKAEAKPETTDSGLRMYDLYISYSTSYRVPKMYLVGFNSEGLPLSPKEMFQDIAGDYRHKTVTIEKAPFLKDTTVVSIHPCKHANVMKVLMKHSQQQRAQQQQQQLAQQVLSDVGKLSVDDNSGSDQEAQTRGKEEDEDEDWQEVHDDGIRVDQYLVVFLKFMSSVTPGIEHDYTMEAL